MYEIKIIPKKELDIILPFLQLLNEKTAVDVLKRRITEMKRQNYICVGIYDNKKLIGISGVWLLFKFYVGRHIEPDNVVVHPDYRRKKVGEQLMQWIHQYGKEKSYPVSELNVYVMNTRGQKFWMQQGYKIIGYHMKKDL